MQMKRLAVVATLAILVMTLSGYAAAPDAAAGKELYAKKCASCHAAAGEGKDTIAKMLKIELKHLGSKEVQAKSDADLAKAVKEGTGKMKPVSGLAEKDIQDVVAFLRTLAKKVNSGSPVGRAADRGATGDTPSKGWNMNTLQNLDRSLQKSNTWLRDALIQLDWTDPHRAYVAIRAVFHALRNRLPLAEVAHLGAQLPTFLRGVYYEGWTPARPPVKNRKKAAFLGEIQDAFKPNTNVDADHVARAIIRVLMYHVSQGEMEQIRNAVPHEIRQLWPAHMVTLRKAS